MSAELDAAEPSSLAAVLVPSVWLIFLCKEFAMSVIFFLGEDSPAFLPVVEACVVFLAVSAGCFLTLSVA